MLNFLPPLDDSNSALPITLLSSLPSALQSSKLNLYLKKQAGNLQSNKHSCFPPPLIITNVFSLIAPAASVSSVSLMILISKGH
jgi:hypothetical protein